MILPDEYVPEYGLDELGIFDAPKLPRMYFPEYQLGAFGIDQQFRRLNQSGLTESQLASIAFFKSIHRRVVINDMSFLGGVEGPHRSAKSTTTTFLGYLLDPTFWKYYDERLVIEPKEIMDAINNIEKNKIHGGVIQIEEAGIGLASADRYEFQAKILEKVVQGIGWLNPIIFFISLDRQAVNPRMRRLLQMVFTFEKANTRQTTMYPRELYYIKSKSGGAWGTKCPMVEFLGENRSLTEIEFMRPPQFIIDRYEEYAGKTKPETFAKLNKEIQLSERQKMKEERDIKKVVLEVVSKYTEFQSEESKPDRIVLDKVAIRYGMGIASEEAIWVKREAEKILRAGARELKKNVPENNDNERDVGIGIERGPNPP